MVGRCWLCRTRLVGGLLVAAAILMDTLKVTVTDTSVEFEKNESTVTVPPEKVAVAFLDGQEIVLQDARSREPVRDKHDLLAPDTEQFPAAFRAHGYPWSRSPASPASAGKDKGAVLAAGDLGAQKVDGGLSVGLLGVLCGVAGVGELDAVAAGDRFQ